MKKLLSMKVNDKVARERWQHELRSRQPDVFDLIHMVRELAWLSQSGVTRCSSCGVAAIDADRDHEQNCKLGRMIKAIEDAHIAARESMQQWLQDNPDSCADERHP